MRLLVCGATGMLGRDVVRAAELAGHAVLATSRGDLDVTDWEATRRAAQDAHPHAIVNCAAYTNVDGAEAEPESAMRVNAQGARNVSAAAAEIDASVLYVSTDYVFDGSKDTPYVESDEPSPLGSYGSSKLAGEIDTAAVNPRHHLVRTSWLFGTGGRNFVETMLELGSRRGEVSVVTDQVGSPTYTPHLAEGIVRVLGSDSYGLHHMTGAGQCSWFDFAVAIFDRAGLPCSVLPTTTERTGRPAPRPAYSVLATQRDDAIHLPAWQAGLDDYMDER
ncbi:MAG: dTDP-4-dehydrorhamnose reductase [Actinobacteria bacterium]|nr:dTDP-4-dehydrorhamnose reductase [Actinomycetota bacterium]